MPATTHLDRAASPLGTGSRQGSHVPYPTGSAVVSYLKDVAEIQRHCSAKQQSCSTEMFLLKHGRQMPVATHSAPKVAKGPNGHCFHNATRHCIANEGRGLIYCEGFAIPPGLIPLHHAWLCTPQGEVFDPTATWEDCRDYFGVAFKHSFHVEMMLRSEYHSILGHWQLGWPVERGEYKPSRFLHKL